MATNIDANWSRWLFASLSVHFYNRRNSFPFYVEGQVRGQEVTNFAEFRMDGPYFNELTVRHWQIDVMPAILIQIVQDDEDIHKLERILGTFTSAFTTDIPVYRYGDDGTQLGCLSLVPANNERIRVDKFGQIQPATRIAQASIEAHYYTHLSL